MPSTEHDDLDTRDELDEIDTYITDQAEILAFVGRVIGYRQYA